MRSGRIPHRIGLAARLHEAIQYLSAARRPPVDISAVADTGDLNCPPAIIDPVEDTVIPAPERPSPG